MKQPRISSPAARLTTGLAVATAMIAVATTPASASSTPDCPTGSTATPGQDYCTVTFTTAGSTQWVVPANVSKVDILAVGGGGAGGEMLGGYDAGGGGGGGQVSVFTDKAVTAGESLAVTVGAGGAIGSTNGQANNGGNSQVAVGADTFVANGGQGGYSGGSFNTSTNTIQNGGDAGNGNAGGVGIPSPVDQSYVSSFYPLAGGGAGAGGAGQSAAAASGDSALSDADFVAAMNATNTPLASGAGGPGVVPTQGLFADNSTMFGIGGGGGAFTFTFSANSSDYNDAPGQETGGSTGSWGDVQTTTTENATTPVANSGDGGGGGAFLAFNYTFAGASAAPGADGVVEIRFIPSAPRVVTPPVVKHHPSANVYFGLNKTTLSPAAVTMLNAYVREIVKNDVTALTINGFADAQGGLAHNEWLSKTRASVVASFIRAALAKAGDHKVAVTASGKGVLKSSVSYQLDRVVAVTSK